MARNDFHDIVTLYRKGSFIFIVATSIISLIVTFFWVLGVPGIQNEYAKGWALGLKTLSNYFIGNFILLVIYLVVAKVSQRFYTLLSLNLIVVSIFWIFFCYSVFKLGLALQIIISG